MGQGMGIGLGIDAAPMLRPQKKFCYLTKRDSFAI
jgi:hypothetical protein